MWKQIEKNRLFTLFCFAILAVYFLVPSVIYFTLSENEFYDVQQCDSVLSKYKIPYFTNKHLVKGLDLQGGVRIILDVDIEKAIDIKIQRMVSRLSLFSKNKRINFKSMSYKQTGHEYFIYVVFDQRLYLEFFKSKVANKVRDLRISSVSNNILVLKLNEDSLNKIKQSLINQTIKTVRSRIDKLGVIDPEISLLSSYRVQLQLPGLNDSTEIKNIIGRTARLEFRMCEDGKNFLIKLKKLPTFVKLQRSIYSKPNGVTGSDIFLVVKAEKLKLLSQFLKGKVPGYTKV